MKIAYPFFIAAVFSLFIGCQSQTKNTESAQGVTQITKLHCEPTGHFAHNPEPLPENVLLEFVFNVVPLLNFPAK